MHRAIAFLAFACAACAPPDAAPGADGAPGQAGPPGEPQPEPEARVGDIVPETVLLGRDVDVALTFHAVELKEAPTLEFGAGIEVSDVQLVSPTTVYAHVSVAADAEPGTRDVLASVAGETFSFGDALDVSPAVTVTLSDERPNELIEGRFAVLEADNLDPDNDFDCGSTGGLFSWPNVYFAGPLYSFGPDACSPRHLTGLVLLSPVASGPFDVINGQYYAPVLHFAGQPMQVGANPPLELIPGESVAGQNLAEPLSSHTYAMTVTGAAIATVEIVETGSGDGVWPLLVALGGDGSFDDMLDWPWPSQTGTRVRYPVIAGRNERTYFVYYDGYLGGGDAATYGFDVVPSVTPIANDQQLDEGEPNDTEAAALPSSAPLIVSGSFGDAGDIDRFGIALNQGQKLEAAIDTDARLHWTIEGSIVNSQSNFVTRIALVNFTAPATGVYTLALRPIVAVPSPANYAFSLMVQ